MKLTIISLLASVGIASAAKVVLNSDIGATIEGQNFKIIESADGNFDATTKLYIVAIDASPSCNITGQTGPDDTVSFQFHNRADYLDPCSGVSGGITVSCGPPAPICV